MRNDKKVVTHELCHQQQMREEGGAHIFHDKYWNDPVYRCEVELACGADKNHWGCQGIELRIRPQEEKEEILTTENTDVNRVYP